MKISVIIPVYNAGKYLSKAVESVLSTGHNDLEIMIVDDGSTDDSHLIACRYAQQYPQVVKSLTHRGQASNGVSASRNSGIRKSTGEAICFLDADDYMLPHRFETSVPILKQNRHIGAVYELTRMVFDSVSEEMPFWNEAYLFGIYHKVDSDCILNELLKGTSWATSAILIRRSLLGKTGLFSEKLHIAEDCHLWMRLACVGKIVAGNMDRPVSIYRRHHSNTYRPALERKIDMIVAMTDVWRWAQCKSIAPNVKAVMKRGIRNYILNSVIVLREKGRTDLARKALMTGLLKGLFELMFYTDMLRQAFSLLYPEKFRHFDPTQPSMNIAEYRSLSDQRPGQEDIREK